MEEKAKRVRVYSEAEKEYRRKAQRKRMENPEYRERKRLVDLKRLENKDVRARKQAMDREWAKREDVAKRSVEKHILFRQTDKYKEWAIKRVRYMLDKRIADSVGDLCPIVFVKCLDCGVIQTKKGRFVREGKASQFYCTLHQRVHKNEFVSPRKIDVVCVDCGTVCQGNRKRMVCDACRVVRVKSRKKTNLKEIERKRNAGGNHIERARKRGVYRETINVVKVYERDKWRCVSCGCKVVRSRNHQANRATLDHRIPLSAGGSHTYENLQTMCVICNSHKCASIPVGVQLSVFDRVVSP